MLLYSEDDRLKDAVIMSFDPGSDTLGIAVSRLCGVMHTLNVEAVYTITASYAIRHTKYYRAISDIHGELPGRLIAISDAAKDILEEHRPDICCSESPFLGKSIDGYAKLYTVVTLLHTAIIHQDRFIPLTYYTPQRMKSAIGALVKTPTKDGVAPAIRELAEDHSSGLVIADHIDLSTLSEHALDAIGVAYCQYLDFRTADDLFQGATYVPAPTHL